MSRWLNKSNSCIEVGKHLRDTDNADYLVKQGFVPCTPKKMVFIGDGSKNLFVYEAINGEDIMEAECARKLSWGHTAPRLPPKYGH